MTTSRKPGFRMGPDLSHQTCSTFLPSSAPSNPVYDKVDALIDSVQESDVFDKIAQSVELFIVDGVFDEAGYLNYVEQFYPQLDQVVDAFEQTEVVPPVMPPAPSPKVLYNRAADVEVVDIGSGDCEKVKLCQGKVIATDKFPQENPHYEVIQLDAEKELRDFVEDKSCVVTSFNVISQFKNIDQVEDVDGIHVVPDITVVKDIMGVEFDSDGDACYGKFKDRDNGVLGDKLEYGYLGYNTYKAMTVRLKPLCSVFVNNRFAPQCKDVYYCPPDLQPTPKYNGECMLLSVCSGQSILSKRNGTGYSLTGVAPDMVLMLEKLPLDGKPEVFVLLRVMSYRGYYPFHGLNNLVRFAKRVNIRMGGAKVLPPGHPDLERYDTDGLIFRVGQLDLRYKSEMTVDLDYPQEAIRKLETKYGYVIDIIGEYPEGNNEFVVTNVGGKYTLKFKRPRPDKTGTTSVDRFSRMLQWI